jgi:peptidoglycan hydrolase CwlO-like protein
MRALIRKKRVVVGVVAPVVIGALLVSGCGELRAERQGVQAGRAVCDIKDADDPDDAERQLRQAERQFSDLARIVGRPIDEDVSDIEENLSDLLEHIAQGNDALIEQDIAVIQRNIDAVGDTLTGKARAAYDGVQEGLAECDYS